MPMQMAELHYRSSPTYDAASIAKRVDALIHSGIEFSEPENNSKLLHFFHTRYKVQYTDGSAPAQTAILGAEQRTDATNYVDTIQQSWACNDAQERLEACESTRLVTEMMAKTLKPSDRMALFHGVLQALVEITQPHAIVFTHSQQIIAPDTYLASCNEAPIRRPGTLNVRFFRVAGSNDGDMMMDTRGLDEIGLYDLQCHYRSLDPNDVCRVLYNTAFYIYENGPIIESGQTIEGTEPNSNWRVQFENSLLEPKREIMDLNPGKPFAAGER